MPWSRLRSLCSPVPFVGLYCAVAVISAERKLKSSNVFAVIQIYLMLSKCTAVEEL